MGLDMYLSKKSYINNKYRDKTKQVKVTVPKAQKGVTFPTKPIKTERVSEITEEVGYWRKANAIHKWFVDNVQDGDDDCGNYDVSSEKLKELLGVVTDVLNDSELTVGVIQNGWKMDSDGKRIPLTESGKYIKDPTTAKSLLPTTEGFFFGGTAYDQYYYEDLVTTKKMLEDLIAEDPTANYEYHSSW